MGHSVSQAHFIVLFCMSFSFLKILPSDDLHRNKYWFINGAKKIEMSQGFFFVFSGAEILPHCQWNLGDFFPNFEKKIPIFKKKDYFFEDSDFIYLLFFFFF